MPADFSISSGADLVGSSWTPPKPSNGALIPDKEGFHEAFQNASHSADTPEKIEGAAKQFEALMIGQILKTARESSGGGWLNTEDDSDDQSGSLVMEMAEQGFAQAMAVRGGLGIAKMVAANLERGQAKTPSSDSGAPTALAPKNTDSQPGLPLVQPGPAPAPAPPGLELPHPTR